MKKRALRKDFYMEIKRSFNRFMSIFFIVALGVAFYSGIQASAPDMEDSGDAYFDRQKLMDLKVISTMGLTSDDVEALDALDGIETAEGAYMTDVLYGEGSNQKVLHIESITEQFQKLQVEEGVLPSEPGECFLDTSVAAVFDVQVGDTISVREDGDEEDHVLARDTFTVTGIGASPMYISFGKGNTTLGSGEVLGFCYIVPEDFDMEVYTQIFMAVEGAEEAGGFSKEYRSMVEKAQKEVEGIETVRCQARYDDIQGEANEKIADAEKELGDGKKEAEEKLADAKKDIAEGEEKLADGKEQLEQGKKDLEDAKKKVSDGRSELEDKEQEYADGQKEIAENEQELIDARAEIAEKEQELANAQAEINSGLSQLASGKETLAASESKYNTQAETLSSGESALADAKANYEGGVSQYEAGVTQLNEAYVKLEVQKKTLDQAVAAAGGETDEYQQAYAEIDAARAQLDVQSSALVSMKVQLESAKQEIDANEAQLAAGRSKLNEAKVQLDNAKAELAANEASLNSAQAEVNNGWGQITSAKAELDSGEQKLEEAKAELADARVQLDDGWAELSNGDKEIQDAEADIADAEKTIAENEQKLADGKKDYAEAEAEVKDTIADGEAKIADAKKELADLDFPEWNISNRNDLSDYKGYGENADRMRSLGEVFPVLFFLVAALISLTTMTRMVEEERTQIGTLKALGYGKLSIANKYISYAVLATVGGSVVGVLFGEKVFPYVIITAYGIMYQHMDVLILNYQMDHALVASLVALFCTMAGTISACYRELAAMPSVLMRPPAPKEGKRVLLERITFIWKHLSFSWKSTVRNLFRYKKRLFMTILGIGGCMALILVGFGLRDSIMDVALIQYGELQTYDAMIILDDDAEEEDRIKLEENMASRSDVEDHMNVYMKKLAMKGKEGQCDVYLMMPETMDGFDNFVHTRNRISKEAYELSDEGIILAEKTAKMAGIHVGDSVSITGENGKEAELPVVAICENYMQHYAYISPGLYEKAFGEMPKYNNIIFKGAEDDESAIEQTGLEILQEDAALSITYTGTIAARLDDMLGSLDVVIVVLIVSAGMLAFVVLYNLNNININERKRELATLKVLGFFDVEVSSYVFRENILLTFLGAALGAGLGKILHEFIITTVEIDSYMFGRTVKPMSYLISIALTFGFSLFVNGMMHFKLKRIDMVESLKSVE